MPRKTKVDPNQVELDFSPQPTPKGSGKKATISPKTTARNRKPQKAKPVKPPKNAQQPNGSGSNDAEGEDPPKPEVLLGCLGRPKGKILGTAYRVISDPNKPGQKRATQRHPLQKLAFKSGSKTDFYYVWDEDYLMEQAGRIVKKRPSANAADKNQGAPSSVNPSASPEIMQSLEGAWEKFSLDEELKTKLTKPEFVEAINRQGPPPKKPGRKKTNNETDEQFDKRKTAYSNWKSKFQSRLKDHHLDGLPETFILYEPEGQPPRRANISLLDVLFRREYGVFDLQTLVKQIESIVDTGIKAELKRWLRDHPNASREQWEACANDFQLGAPVKMVRLWESATTLNNHKDLSKDGKGAYYQQENAKGYWIGVKKENGKIASSTLYPIKAWDSKASVKEKLESDGYKPYESESWRWGDVLWINKDSGVWKRGFYTFRNATLSKEGYIELEADSAEKTVSSKITKLLKGRLIKRVII